METRKILIGIKEYVLITLGILCYVLGWAIFLVPNNLIGGGVTGLASIVQYATGGAVKMGYTYFLVNAGLLIAALFVLGPEGAGRWKRRGGREGFIMLTDGGELLITADLAKRFVPDGAWKGAKVTVIRP